MGVTPPDRPIHLAVAGNRLFLCGVDMGHHIPDGDGWVYSDWPDAAERGTCLLCRGKMVAAVERALARPGLKW